MAEKRFLFLLNCYNCKLLNIKYDSCVPIIQVFFFLLFPGIFVRSNNAYAQHTADEIKYAGTFISISILIFWVSKKNASSLLVGSNVFRQFWATESLELESNGIRSSVCASFTCHSRMPCSTACQYRKTQYCSLNRNYFDPAWTRRS